MKNLQKISERNKLLFLSLAVGLASGLAAVVLERLISLIQKGLAPIIAGSSAFHWSYVLLPGVGMLLSFLLVKYVVKDNIGHGVTKVLLSVSRNESRIKPHNMWSSVITSSLTIGFGGSVGAEAPIVYTGAAIGSNVGQKFNLSHRGVTILVGCGAAGAIAGIFQAPLAGVLFTLEILLFNISMTSMMPLLLSTVTATVVSSLLIGDSMTFKCTVEAFSMSRIPFYLILGIMCGMVSLYFTRSTLYLEDRISRFGNPWIRWICCAMGLGLLIMLFPPLFGEGYSTVRALLNVAEDKLSSQQPFLLTIFDSPWDIPIFFTLVMLLKVVSMTLTNAGGGVGGTFGPTLVVGALAGFVVVRSLNLLNCQLPEQNFVLVGMAGLMAGVMQAPMTAIFLIAEITGGYELLLPLIICSTVSFGTTRIWEKYSIYTKRIAQSGDLLTHDSAQAVLTLMDTDSLIKNTYARVYSNDSLGKLVKTISESTGSVIAVVDRKGRFQGMINISDARKHLFNTEEYGKLKAYNLMTDVPEYIYVGEKMDVVMDKFESTDAWRLPVVNSEHQYMGFISRSRILAAYREKLKEISPED